MRIRYINNKEIAIEAKKLSDASPVSDYPYPIDVIGCATQVLGLRIFFEDLKVLTGHNALGLIIANDKGVQRSLFECPLDEGGR